MAQVLVAESSNLAAGCVIIGGGVAGQETARQLKKNGVDNITIVQANPFVESTFMTPYFVTRPDVYEATVNTKKGVVASIEHLSIPGVKYAVGTVTAVEKNAVVFNKGKLEFNTLVVAVGLSYPALTASPGEDLATRTAFVRSFAGKVAAAKAIVIGGGGPVSMEMVFECRRLNSDAKITLVTSADHAMGQWTGKASAKVTARLEYKNIEVITKERVEGNVDMCLEPARYKLASGKVLEADIFLPYFGLARTGFLATSLPDSVGRGGRVKVNANGQSVVNSRIFAVGCSDNGQLSLKDNIDADAKTVATNIADVMKSAEPTAFFPPAPTEQPVPMYAHLGVGQYTVMNLPKGLPALCGRCCGCCNPFCPCCGCMGWPCCFPASELQGTVMGKMLVGMGNMMKPHAKEAPEIQRME